MKPTIPELASALRQVGVLLGADHADYCFEGRFRFELADDWSLVISPDSAGRFCLEVCFASRVRARLWCHAGDRARLEALVLSAWQEAAALAA